MIHHDVAGQPVLSCCGHGAQTVRLSMGCRRMCALVGYLWFVAVVCGVCLLWYFVWLLDPLGKAIATGNQLQVALGCATDASVGIASLMCGQRRGSEPMRESFPSLCTTHCRAMQICV